MADKGGFPTGPLAKAGYVIIVASLGGLFPGVRDVLTNALAKYSGVPNPDVPYWIAFAVFLIGVMMVTLDWFSNQGLGRTSSQALALKHTSLSDIQPMSLNQSDLPRRDGRLGIENIACDLTTEMAHGHTEIAAAINKQQRTMQALAIRLQANPRPRLAYYGVAHIPFQLWAGCQLTHAGAYLYELIRETGGWRELDVGRVRNFKVDVRSTTAVQPPAALVIRVAVSFPVDMADIKDVVSEPILLKNSLVVRRRVAVEVEG